MKPSAGFVTIDSDAVARLAASLRDLPLSSSFATTLAPEMPGARESCLRACLWAASICHSTKGGLRGTFGGQLFNGWDFLIRAFAARCGNNEDTLESGAVAEITEDGLAGLLTAASVDACVTLHDVGRRAEILRQTAQELKHLYDGSVSGLLDRAHNMVGGDTGAYRLLSALTAFQDPLMKKSGAFLLTAHFAKLWTILDQARIQPMIDYRHWKRWGVERARGACVGRRIHN